MGVWRGGEVIASAEGLMGRWVCLAGGRDWDSIGFGVADIPFVATDGMSDGQAAVFLTFM